MTAVRGGENFATAARSRGFTMAVTSETWTRRQASEAIPARGMPDQIFAAAQGDVMSDLRSNAPSILVAQVEQINRVDLAARAQDVEVARMRMQVDNPFTPRAQGDGSLRREMPAIFLFQRHLAAAAITERFARPKIAPSVILGRGQQRLRHNRRAQGASQIND